MSTVADTATSRAALAQAVAAAARAVDGVVDLSPGPWTPPVATLAPGGTITGVHLGDDRVAVHVVVDRFPLPPLLDAVRRQVEMTLRDRGDGREVFVRVEDVVLPDEAAAGSWEP